LLFSGFGRGLAAIRRVVARGAVALCVLAGPVAAQMPEPYVSPAFDAVLMPVTQQVVAQFKLPRTASGAVVVSVEPGGVADLYGMEPGEVITSFGNKKFRRPADLDAMVLKSLQDGNSYFYFQGLRKGRDKRTIIYLEEEEYRRPVAVKSIPKWRSYNAPSFNFARWYYPYSYYIVDIWDYSVYYVDQVVVSDVFVTSYYSEETYFYYDYTEISTLEVRESWVEEEATLYCGDVAGYDCGVEEVGYPVEQEFDSCSGEAGDDWCLPPETVDADYCASFPSDEGCAGLAAEDDYCAYNPDDPDCGGTEDGAAYCALYPDDAACGGEGADAGDYAADAEAGAEEEFAGDAGEDVAAEDYAGEEDAGGDAGDGYAEDASGDGYDGDASGDGYDGDASDDGYDGDAGQDGGVDDGYAAEEGGDDGYAGEQDSGGAVEEEQVYDEPVSEEPAYEEPAYEEPAYEEPAYEEPAGEDGGDGCYLDEEGNPVC